MTNNHTEEAESKEQSHEILKKAVELSRQGRYLVAAKLLKKGLEYYPGQKEFLGLLAKLEPRIKKQQIEKLQEEALLLMQSGETESAQMKLRQIVKLDPSRTDLKESFRKTFSEVKEESARKERIAEIIRLSIRAAIGISVFASIVAIWAGIDNRIHLRRAQILMERKRYNRVRKELNKCGWFMANEKSQIQDGLERVVQEKVNEANQLSNMKEYWKAAKVMEVAARALEDPNKFKARIEQLEELDRIQEAEKIAKAEAEKAARAALRAALQSKSNCERAADIALKNNADTFATEFWQEAGELVTLAQNLVDTNQFDEAQEAWDKAEIKYDEAKIAAVNVERKRQKAISAQEICRTASETAKSAFAHIDDSSNLWEEAEEEARLAEQYFEGQKFTEAHDTWLMAADKYSLAADAAHESPAYKRSAYRLQKWEGLKTGLAKDDVLAILGRPKCIQGASDEQLWYYQYSPRIEVSNDGNKRCIEPRCGFVRFTPVSIDTILERMEEAYEEKVEQENTTYEMNMVIKAKNYERRLYKISKGLINKTRAEVTRDYQKDVEEYKRMHQRILEDAEKAFLGKEKALISGLAPRELNYVLSSWKEPAPTDMASLTLVTTTDEEQTPKPRLRRTKWQMPSNWRKLKLHVNEKVAHKTLGLPTDVQSNNEERIEYYGDIPDYGLLLFTLREDSLSRLSYWKEPLWDEVKKELTIKVEY